MAEFEVKDMTGSLWTNEKPKSDRSPAFLGSVKINGTLYRLSGFKNTTKSGNKPYIGLTVQEDERQQQSAPAPAAREDDPWGI